LPVGVLWSKEGKQCRMLVSRASFALRYLGSNEADDGFEIIYEVPKQLVILILFGTKGK